MPDVKVTEIPAVSDMGVAIEGSAHWWPNEMGEAVLPEFDPYHQQLYYIEIFNRGTTPFEYSVRVGEPWIKVNSMKGKISTEERLWVNIDWKKAPKGKHRAPITVDGPNDLRIVIYAAINNPVSPKRGEEIRFVESNGYVSIEAENYARVVNTHPITWQKIPDLGRTQSAMTPFPVTAATQTPQGDSPRMEYRVHLFVKGEVTVKAYLSPTLNFHNNQGLRYGISFDNEPPQIINMHSGKTFQDWEESVRNNVTVEVSKHTIAEPGKHVLKFWVVDPGVVLQKLVIETGKVRPSYLGPPESHNGSVKTKKK